MEGVECVRRGRRVAQVSSEDGSRNKLARVYMLSLQDQLASRGKHNV